MGLLSEEEKREIRWTIRRQFPTDPESKLQIDIALRGAITILTKTLGEKWADRYVSPTPGQSDSGFLKRGLTSDIERLTYVDRIMMLAEFLNVLSELKNFQSKVKDLRTKSLEETFFELEVAYNVKSRGFGVEFVVPSRTKGQDYDLAVQIGQQRLAIEVKCRTSDSPFTENSLKNPLKRAARVQLPKEGSNVIFFRIPTRWTLKTSFIAAADNVLNHFLKDYSRINMVVLWWEEWSTLGPFARTSKFRSYVNAKPKFRVNAISTLITDIELPPIDAPYLAVTYI
jgi:hypothetical protein